MKAVLCKEYGPPERLVVEEVASPRPGPGQVLVRVRAAGVNFPDTLIIQGKYQFKPEPPFSPGGEVAGELSAVGEGVKGWKPGDRVAAITLFGGYAEEIAVAAEQLVPLPENVPFDIGAAFLTAYGTSYYALRDRAHLGAGESLLVLGAGGGVGLAAVEIGKRMGARVIAAASDERKLAACREAGADAVIDYTKEDLKTRVRELTGGNGADVIYDPVGGAYSETALRAIAWGGRFLVIGFAAGEIPKIPLNLTLLKSCSIVGVFWGSWLLRSPSEGRAAHTELFRWLAEGALKPHVSGRYPLHKAGEALRAVIERRALGKLVLET
jgi:NADPH2:quinone reductase